MRTGSRKEEKSRIEWSVLVIPFFVVVFLSVSFGIFSEKSQKILMILRDWCGNQFGVYYLFLGIGAILVSIYMSCSKLGNIRLGKMEKPQYTNFQWGAMIFTSTMAADILFYSLSEWALYSGETYIQGLGDVKKWAPTFSLFHWGPISWSFYIVLAVSFGFMLHVRGREKHRFSEACRPLLGKKVDGWMGKGIDLFAVIALLAGTATTFSLATPLLSRALTKVFGFKQSLSLTILLLIAIAIIYTVTVWFGMVGVFRLATVCTYLFFFLLGYVFFLGGESRFIIETGFSSIGNLLQNFIGMATWTDPGRETYFPQNWTVFYWAYWMAWCVATPFFLGVISKGRTIRETVFGTYGWGLGGTFLSFIILGNYGLSKEVKGVIQGVNLLKSGKEPVDVILSVLETLPFAKIVLVLLVITMVAFYATTFDSLTMVVSFYSYKHIPVGGEPDRKIRVFWAVLFIFLPIGLLFSQNSMSQLQSVSIIAAFPIGIIMFLIVYSFFVDAKRYLEEVANLDEIA